MLHLHADVCFALFPRLVSFRYSFHITLSVLDHGCPYFLVGIIESGESILTLKGPQGRINRAVWGPLNRTIISGGEDSVVRMWDAEVSIVLVLVLNEVLSPKSIVPTIIASELQTGKLLKESEKEEGHKKAITSLSKSVDGSHFLTGSLDKSAKVCQFLLDVF